MILVGLKGCPGCHVFHARHPDLKYVEIPKEDKNITQEIQLIKEALTKLGLDAYPQILSDDLNKVIPLDVIEPILEKKEENK